MYFLEFRSVLLRFTFGFVKPMTAIDFDPITLRIHCVVLVKALMQVNCSIEILTYW